MGELLKGGKLAIDADLWDDIGEETDEDGTLTIPYSLFRVIIDAMSERSGDWQGRPVPVEGLQCVLQSLHPLKKVYEEFHAAEDDVEIEVLVGGPPVTEEPEVVRNLWYSRERNSTVFVLQQGDKIFSLERRHPHSRAMDRFDLGLYTLLAADGWSEDAEHAAREKLRGMLSERQYHQYDMTGTFMEESKRSQVHYMFRRLRPTLALSWRNRRGDVGEMSKLLTALCMHPIGYYSKSWGGCMTPTDDVIAHLCFMRGDEARFWGQANHHAPWEPEAGI